MLDIYRTSQFKKDFKKIKKRNLDTAELEIVLRQLANQKTLASKYKDYSLSGNYLGHRECHIQPDWLLIYKIEEERLILTLTRTGSHADLF